MCHKLLLLLLLALLLSGFSFEFNRIFETASASAACLKLITLHSADSATPTTASL